MPDDEGIARQAQSSQVSRAIKWAGVDVPVKDPHDVQTVFVDLMTNAGEHHGVVSMTLGTFVNWPLANGQSEPDVVICARLRFNLATATDIRNMLDSIIKNAMPRAQTLS